LGGGSKFGKLSTCRNLVYSLETPSPSKIFRGERAWRKVGLIPADEGLPPRHSWGVRELGFRIRRAKDVSRDLLLATYQLRKYPGVLRSGFPISKDYQGKANAGKVYQNRRDQSTPGGNRECKEPFRPVLRARGIQRKKSSAKK